MGAIKTVFFDADGTLLVAENPYFHIARQLGCEQESKELVQQYLKEKISYEELAEKEQRIFVEYFQKRTGHFPRRGDFEQLLPPVSIRDWAQRLIASLQTMKIEVFVLSSGIDVMVMELSKIGISANNIFANSFRYDDRSGNTRLLKREIHVSGDKIEAFSKILNDRNLSIPMIVYVGDNAFDRKILEYVRDRGGWTIILSTGEEKEVPLGAFQKNRRSFVANNLQEVGDTIRNILNT